MLRSNECVNGVSTGSIWLESAENKFNWQLLAVNTIRKLIYADIEQRREYIKQGSKWVSVGIVSFSRGPLAASALLF